MQNLSIPYPFLFYLFWRSRKESNVLSFFETTQKYNSTKFFGSREKLSKIEGPIF